MKALLLGLVASLTIIDIVGGGAADRLLLIGTYTQNQSKGIYAFRFNDQSGALVPLGLAAETPSPSFLTASANGRYVFAVNEISMFNGERSGSVTSFSVNRATGRLTAINTESSRGASPCHLMLDRTGRFLGVANYTSGNFGLLPVGVDGHLQPIVTMLTNSGSGPNRGRQDGPHAHAVLFDAANRFMLGADPGTDRVFVYRFDPATGRTVANDPPAAAVDPGAGPRHLAWHPKEPILFSVNELTSTVTAFQWSPAKGHLTTIATVSTLPADYRETNSTAEIVVHPTGRFLYASNRGSDSIAVFQVGSNGALRLVEIEPTRGKTPRNFAVDPTGRWLIAANQNSGTLAVFRIDRNTGELSLIDALSAIDSPVCVLFL